MDQLPSGKILTFYSYKGGTGRSMAVANFGCWLARRDASPDTHVLLIDWDLEAPGLHRYFPVADSGNAARSDGLIDYFYAIRDALDGDETLYAKIAADDGAATLRERFPLSPYISRNVFPGVDLIRAGRLDADYPQRVSSFKWIDFHSKHGKVFQALREMIATDYPYCLIDSRTGFNDVSGICTMLMPEKLVLVFTPNRQSLSGVLDIAARAVNYRRSADDFRPLSIFPLPSRIENAELELKQRWRKIYQSEFEATLTSVHQLDDCGLTEYFDDVLLPHVSFYSYGEEIAVLREKHSDALSLRRAYDSSFKRLETTEFAWDGLSGAEQPIEATSRRPSPVERVDVFISYTHIDNQPLLGESRGWVDVFAVALEQQLSMLLGAKVRIWRDQKLSGNDNALGIETTQQIIRDARCFVAILSPRYVHSDWCRAELDTFLAGSRGDELRGGRGNLFKVFRWPLDWADEPERSRKYLGYEFYGIDEKGTPRALDPTEGDMRARFLAQISSLAWQMKNQLEAESTDSLQVRENNARAIYVAETSSDIVPERDRIVNELRRHGYSVLPDRELPRESAAVQDAVRGDLARCDVSVHMVGQRYGIIPEGDERSLVQLQYEMAAERSLTEPSFSRIIWVPPGLVPTERRLSAFVEELHATASASEELVTTSLEDLKLIVLAKLGAAAESPRLPEDRAPTLIYLIHDDVDADAVLPITRYLYEHGCYVASPGDNRRADATLLAGCDAVLIYYGGAPMQWIMSRLAVVRKSLVEIAASKRPLAVMLGPPGTPEKESFRSPQLGGMVLNALHRAQNDVLAEFVEVSQHRSSRVKDLL